MLICKLEALGGEFLKLMTSLHHTGVMFVVSALQLVVKGIFNLCESKRHGVEPTIALASL